MVHSLIFGLIVAHLATSKFLAGDHLTLADIFHIPYGHYTMFKTTGNADLFDSRPHLKAWFHGLLSTANSKKVLPA